MRITVVMLFLTLLTGGSRLQSGDADEVLKTQRTLIEAMAKCDRATVDRLTTDDEVTVGPAGNISTKAERATSGRQCVPYKAASVSDARVRVYGADTAVVTGRIVINTPDGKSLPEARFTAVFVKDGGVWKEASYQGTAIRPATTPAK